MTITTEEIANRNSLMFRLNNEIRPEYIEKYRDEYREALATNNYPMVFYYLDQNPKLIDVWETKSGYSFFIKTVLEKNFEYSSLLLQSYGAYIDQVDRAYQTVLHHAAIKGDLELVKYLVEECGASYNQMALFGHTPVMLACFNKHNEVVKYFVEKVGVDLGMVDGEYMNILGQAVRVNNLELVNWLIGEKNLDVNFISEDFRDCIIKTKSALIIATNENNFDMVKTLIESYGARLDIADQYGNNVIQNAIYLNSPNTDPEPCNKIILEYLIDKASPEVLDNQNGNYKTALMEAVSYGYIDLVRLLLNKGCDVNLKDDENKTALDYSSDETIKKLLIDSGAIEEVEVFTDSEDEDIDMEESNSDSDSGSFIESTDPDVSITGDSGAILS